MNAILNVQQLIPVWQTLQSLAPIVHIDNEAEYAQVTDLLNCLLDNVRDDPQHPLYSLVSIVGDLIETYELDCEPLDH